MLVFASIVPPQPPKPIVMARTVALHDRRKCDDMSCAVPQFNVADIGFPPCSQYSVLPTRAKEDRSR
jgi:hypothetical protein